MPRPREEYPIRKHTLNLYDGDYDRIQAHYPARIGAAKVIRDLVRNHVRDIKRSPSAKLNYQE